MRCVIAVILLSAAVAAQSPPCPADRPVDDIVAEINKQQSKKSARNQSPLPENICVFGWCREMKKTPPTIPEPAQNAQSPNTGNAGSSSSSSKTPADKCNEATERAIDAAHNVEVGDYYFEKANYKAALYRYQDAVEEKPGDIAIHVRLGRACEKLNDVPQAIEHFKAAEKLAGHEKWQQEAHAAIARLEHT
jgi:tetratricopeptide (TPR) repeat protein